MLATDSTCLVTETTEITATDVAGMSGEDKEDGGKTVALQEDLRVASREAEDGLSDNCKNN